MAPKSNEKCLKKTNLLVYKTPPGQRAEKKIPGDYQKPKYKIKICAPQPKHIRICTGRELKRMCAPKVCKCPTTKPKGRGLVGLLGFGLKAALAAAAWYVTYDMGIWGSSDDTHELYRNYCRLMKAPCEPKDDKWEPVQCTAEKQLFKIPKFDPYGYCDEPPINIQRKAYDFQNRWNSTVASVFSGITEFPYNVINKFKKEQKEETEEEEPQCVPYSKLSEEEREYIIKNAYKK
ncbi:hypothetical protein NQ315_007030 [Exocentrus adspersus]|uniref:MICOS complex subunit MIC13 n=1 Tax=Exocentrus adspersus TaxID=1586481 RepID=A0AAV8WCL3_9CUCU|nr:hypothetical protein NQ315_007030 [Exocentrus adspersus]